MRIANGELNSTNSEPNLNKFAEFRERQVYK